MYGEKSYIYTYMYILFCVDKFHHDVNVFKMQNIMIKFFFEKQESPPQLCLSRQISSTQSMTRLFFISL